MAAELGCAPVYDRQTYCAPGAGLKQKWGCEKGPGPGLWPSNPQKGMATPSPGHNLPAWCHKRIPWEGTEVLPKGTGSRLNFQPAHERDPCGSWSWRCRCPAPRTQDPFSSQTQNPKGYQLPGEAGPGWPPHEGNRLCPQEPQGSGQPQHHNPGVLVATLSPEPGGTLRQGSRSSPQPCSATPTASSCSF